MTDGFMLMYKDLPGLQVVVRSIPSFPLLRTLSTLCGMLCGGNTVIMCGTCNMGRKGFFCRTHFFSYPVTPEKKKPTRYQKTFLPPPPCHGDCYICSVCRMGRR